MGKACGAINERKPAKVIVDEMIVDAVTWLKRGNSYLLDSENVNGERRYGSEA